MAGGVGRAGWVEWDAALGVGVAAGQVVWGGVGEVGWMGGGGGCEGVLGAGAGRGEAVLKGGMVWWWRREGGRGSGGRGECGEGVGGDGGDGVGMCTRQRGKEFGRGDGAGRDEGKG